MSMSNECLATFENYQAATNEQDQSPWFSEMLRLAPPELQKTIRDMAVEIGLLPENVYYTDSGEVMYSLQEVAELNGMTEQELVEDAKKAGIEPSKADPATLHRRQ